MRFVCDSCRAQYMISDDKVGPKGVKVRCKKCSYVILVRKTQDSAAAAPGPAIDEERDETQVMQNPLANLGSQINEELTNPGGSTQEQKNKDNLLGASDDEIGAVFDSVLNSGAHKVPGAGDNDGTPAQGGAALGDDGDDRMSTRVLDAEVMKKLAAEAEGGASSDKPAEKNGKHAEAKPAAASSDFDWYVAIDEKQVGPLKKEAMKEKWDSGEISADSLCWRAGFSDWIPVSEAQELASVLAPRPAKPIIVSSGPAPASPSVVTVPVESAFSSGGVTRTVRSEMSVPMAASGSTSEEPTGWKPSAASALASLVKEEIDALTKPAPVEAKSPVNGEGASVLPGGLLDLPPEEAPRSNGKPQSSLMDSQMDSPAPQPASRPSNGNGGYGQQQQMVNPMANPYPPQPYGQYAAPPQPSGNRTLLIAGGAVVLLLLFVVVGVVVWAVSRTPAQPAYVAQVQPQVEQKQPEVVKPPVQEQKQPVQVAQNTQTETNKNVQQPVAENKAEAKNENPPVAKNEAREEAKEEKVKVAKAEGTSHKSRKEREESNDNVVVPAKATQKEEKPAKEEPSGDDFDSVFGGGGSKKKVAAPPPDEETPRKKNSVYIPPAPGSGENVPDTISQSQVVEVVVGSKDSIKKCVLDQKAKNPAVSSGTIVMKWTVTQSGKASQVSCQSDQFKSEPIAGCLGGVIKGMSFPKHKSAQDPIVFPFKF
ncbi:MAG: adventurous gliding motility protein GltJ [Myxococcaceae bacterium]